MKIGLLSDTHSYLHPRILTHFESCDEIWHAGDFGTLALAQTLAAAKPLRGVYGNIDGAEIRRDFPEDLIFEVGGCRILMTHIGGYPSRYVPRVRKLLELHRPHIYIAGHSHILKVMPDPTLGLLHINPGACGREGWHKVKTLVRFCIDGGKPHSLEVIELDSEE